MCLHTPTPCRNYKGEPMVNSETLWRFLKCLWTKFDRKMKVYFDPQGCQPLL